MSAMRTHWPLLGIVLGIVLVIVLSGCAPAYHAYSRGCIPYCYCPAPPLPYGTYSCCHCPTPIASAFSRRHQETGPAPIDETPSIPESPVANPGSDAVAAEPTPPEP